VRTTARQLRQRLALYYQEEGISERTRIQVPRGGYVPIFVTAEDPVPEPTTAEAALPAEASAAPMQEEATVAKSPARPRLIVAWSGLAAIFAGALLSFFIYRTAWKPRLNSMATDPLWAEIFSSGRTTIFVPGDAGLNTYNIFSGRSQQLSLREYINSNHLSQRSQARRPDHARRPISNGALRDTRRTGCNN
jgi:hypothetical protein